MSSWHRRPAQRFHASRNKRWRRWMAGKWYSPRRPGPTPIRLVAILSLPTVIALAATLGAC